MQSQKACNLFIVKVPYLLSEMKGKLNSSSNFERIEFSQYVFF
jgi:hypothetical protein